MSQQDDRQSGAVGESERFQAPKPKPDAQADLPASGAAEGREELDATEAPRTQQGGVHTDAENRAGQSRQAPIDRDRDYNPDGERADANGVRLGL